MTKLHAAIRSGAHTLQGWSWPVMYALPAGDAGVCEQPLDVRESRTHVLIVDRDPELVELIAYMLHRAGLRYAKANDRSSAVQLFASVRPLVVVVDTHGLDLLQHFTSASHHPAIIVLTTGNTEQARVAALEQGADDYVTKPFSPRELVARIRARLRRSQPNGPYLAS